MKKIFFFFTVIMTVIGMQSCSNADEPQMNEAQTSDFEVVNFNIQKATTRSGNGAGTEADKILKFKDETAYAKTLASVKAMNDAEKVAFFNKIGFDGAYMCNPLILCFMQH